MSAPHHRPARMDRLAVAPILAATAALLALGGCDIKSDKPAKAGEGGAGQPRAGQASPTNSGAAAEDLRALMEGIRKRAEGGDLAGAARQMVELLPTPDALAAAMSPGADPKVTARIAAMHDELRRRTISRIGRPEATQVNVWASTTEELKADERGSVAYREFPGGARQLAQAGILRPGMTWHEVEFVKPGEELGTKYHLFFHDGRAWRMLGQAWDALREPLPAGTPEDKK